MMTDADAAHPASLSIWQGERVRLRAMEPEDWAAFFANNADSEGARRSYAIPFPRSQAGQRRWAEETANATPENDAFRWVIADLAGTVVGTINTHSCDRRVGEFSYGVGVFRQFQRRGFASEAITLVLRYFFEELRYQKCTVGVYGYNEPSIRLHERLGFHHEGRLRRVVFTRGRHFDAIMLGITAEEFAARPAIGAGQREEMMAAEKESGGGGAISGLTGLHHAGYTVPDLDEAVRLFTEVLGFTVLSRGGPLESDADDRMARVFGVHPRASARMAFVRLGTLTVELIHWRAPGQRTEPPVNHDIGAAHLALATTDLDAALARLRAEPGVHVLEPQEGNTFVYVRLPWGMLVQLMAVPGQ